MYYDKNNKCYTVYSFLDKIQNHSLHGYAQYIKMLNKIQVVKSGFTSLYTKENCIVVGCSTR